VQEAASRTKQQTSVAALELDAVGCAGGVTVRKRLAERMRGCLMTLLVRRRLSWRGGDAGGDGEEAEVRRVGELDEEVAVVVGVDARHGAEDDPRIRRPRQRRRQRQQRIRFIRGRHGCLLLFELKFTGRVGGLVRSREGTQPAY
jgi:hypothetical protein